MDDKTILRDLLPIFSSCALEAGEAIFGQDGEVQQDWEVVERLKGNYDLLCAMGSGNTNYKALLCVGVQKKGLAALLEEDEIPLEEASDILGEFLNTYCALLDDETLFQKAFGDQIQTVPMLYMNGQYLLPFISGVQGYIHLGDEHLYVGYTIHRADD